MGGDLESLPDALPLTRLLHVFAGFLWKAFREKIRKAHPDAGGTAQEFKEALVRVVRVVEDLPKQIKYC